MLPLTTLPLLPRRPAARAMHVPVASPRRGEAEAFIARVFDERYAARVTAFAPDLMLLEQAGEVLAAAGWRGAGRQRLFLENYLDQPAEVLISRMAGHPVARDKVVEVGHLASVRPGAAAADWGRYYDTRPIVVAGRIRQALEGAGRRP